MAVVSRWDLDGNATDAVGSNNGELKGGPAFGDSLVSSEPAGQAVDLNGTSQYVQVPNAASLQITGSYWFSIWAERGTTTGEQTLLRKGGDYRLYMNAGSGLGLEHETSGEVEYECQVGTDILAGRFYRIDGVYDAAAKEMRLYVNGRKVKTLTGVNAGPKSSTSALYIGSQAGTSRFWKGRLDKVTIRNSAGSDAEVLAAYREESLEVFADGFETGNTSRWATKQESGGALSVVSAEPIADSYSLKALVEAKGTRAELIPGHVDFFAGDSIYPRLKIRIPEGFASTGWGTLVFQLRDEGDNSPAVAVYIIGGYLYVKGGPATGLAETVYWKGPLVTPGTVYDVLLHVLLSEDAEVGQVQVWLDSVKQGMLASTGRTAIGRSYPKLGLYRDTSIGTAGHVFLDSFAVTRTEPAGLVEPEAKATGTGTGSGSAKGTRGRQSKATGSGSGSGSAKATRGRQGKAAGSGSGSGSGKGTRGRSAKAQGAGSGSGSAAATFTPGERNRIRVRESAPMRQTIICTTPGGKVHRWAEDAAAGQIFSDLSDSGAVPGGDKEMTVTLPRKDGVDYGDMRRGSVLEIYGAGNRVLSAFRLERAPIVSGDHISVSPAASGIETDLVGDNTAQEIFLDADIGGFGTASAKRRAAQTHRFDNASIQVVPAGTPDPEDPSSYSDSPAISHAWSSYNSNAASDVAESWYDGMGVQLGEIHFDFDPVKGVSPSGSWNNQVAGSVDGVVMAEPFPLVDLNGSVATHKVVEFPSGMFQLFLRDHWDGVKEGTVNYDIHWKNIRVLGRHGLPLYGTWPRVGLLASDVVAYVLARWAPHIRFTTGTYGTIKPTRFLVPHLSFKEPTTPAEMTQQATRFELPEWGVWAGSEGPTFHLNPRGQREGSKTWRVRSHEIDYEDTGQQLDKVFNGVVVVGQATDGSTLYIGPAGSGLRYTSERLLDVDPQNAANEAGIKRYAKIQMKGIATLEGMIEAGEAFLEQSKLLDGSGKATLPAYVEDQYGQRWPYYCVKEGHAIEILGSSIPGPRYIVTSSRSRSSRSVSVDIDAPPDSFEAMMERLYAEYVGLALASG